MPGINVQGDDWYWLVGASTTSVFSSKSNSYVPLNDPGFIAWGQAGQVGDQARQPGHIASEAELWVVLEQRAPGHLPAWLFDGVAFSQPAAGQYTIAQLARALVTSATAATETITKQIAATESHLAGYASAANMARAANGAPANDPDKTSFGLLATATGMTAAQLATVVLALDAASVTNLAILMTLETAVAKAQAASDLAAALTAYENALAAFVASLNSAGLTTTIVAPAPIAIPGVSA